MPVPSAWTDISATASSNSPQGPETVGPNMNAYLQAAFAYCAQLYAGAMTPTAALNFNGQKVTNCANGVANTDLATVGQVNTLVGGYVPLSGTSSITGSLSVSANLNAGGALDVTGNVLVSGGIACNYSVRVESAVNVASAQGAYLSWNEASGSGATSIVNNQGGGSGGFILRNTNLAGTETGRVTIDAAGDFTAGGNVTAYSDERLKKDWKPLGDDFIAKLAKVQNGSYMRKDIAIRQVGVSAQSLKKVMPEAVMTAMGTKYLSVAYGHAALAAVVELAREVVELRARLAALEG
jgi:hypothetical protein